MPPLSVWASGEGCSEKFRLTNLRLEELGALSPGFTGFLQVENLVSQGWAGFKLRFWRVCRVSTMLSVPGSKSKRAKLVRPIGTRKLLVGLAVHGGSGRISVKNQNHERFQILTGIQVVHTSVVSPPPLPPPPFGSSSYTSIAICVYTYMHAYLHACIHAYLHGANNTYIPTTHTPPIPYHTMPCRTMRTYIRTYAHIQKPQQKWEASAGQLLRGAYNICKHTSACVYSLNNVFVSIHCHIYIYTHSLPYTCTHTLVGQLVCRQIDT